MNELEIIKAICAGGRNKELAMNALYHKKSAEFRRYFVRRGLSREQAEDLIQDTFFKIFLNANKFTGDGGFGDKSANAWMWSIAKNRMRDHFRAERKSIDISIDDETLDDGSKVRVEWELAVNDPLNPAKQTVRDCVAHGLEQFAEDHADRARVLEMQMDKESVTSIAQHIDRTYGATREYLSQCKKVFQSYIEHCKPLLKPQRDYE
jgi:RNA polymerase sigma factor (sigma-70 family)